MQVALVCGVLAALVDLLTAWTAHGQRFEDNILEAAQRISAAGRSALVLRQINPITGALGGAVVVAIGLSRRRILLAVLAAAVIVASVVTVELVQHLMTRPVLLSLGYRREDQSFPSGHVAIAMSVMSALILVVPHRIRLVTAVIGATAASGIAVAAVASGSHRPADAVGSDLIVLMFTCLALSILSRRGLLSEARWGMTPAQSVRRASGWAVAGLGALALAVVFAMSGTARPEPSLPYSVPIAPGWLLAATLVVVFGCGMTVAAVLLALLRGTEIGPQRTEVTPDPPRRSVARAR
jgi:membrane-associated phospholipid phosphatase